MARKEKHVYQIKKKRNFFNPATVIFLAIFFYIVIYIIAYATKDHTSVYRVISDTTEDVIKAQGVCVRNETVVKADRSGYVNYYIGNLSRCAKSDAICSIDDTGTIYNKLQTETGSGNALNTDLMEVIRQYHVNNDGGYDSLYTLKQKFTNAALSYTGKNMLSNLSDALRDYGNSDYFHVNYATESGIVVYSSDTYDGISVDDVNSDKYTEIINATDNSASGEADTNASDSAISGTDNTKINEGQTLYKLITDETWHIIIMVDKDHYDKLANLDLVSIRINNSTYTANAGIDLFESGGNYFADLTLYNYMVNFADSRVLNVSVTLDSHSGLKIPKSSVIKKDCYLANSKLYISDDHGKSGFYKYEYDKSGNKNIVFVEADLYYIDDKKVAYIAADGNISAGDIITDKDGKDSETINKMDSLTGVYCVNKGYPEFKRIEVEDEFDDYYLLKENTSYGLSEYDNIIVNPESDANLKE